MPAHGHEIGPSAMAALGWADPQSGIHRFEVHPDSVASKD